MEVDGVFEGGGVKGIALLGALSRLEEEGVEFRRVAGTSAGAITAALYAAGYSVPELKEIIWKKNFSEFADVRFLVTKRWYHHLFRKIILLAPVPTAWGRYGIFSTDPVYQWVKSLLERKKVRSFSECPVFLRVFASNVTHQRLLVFDPEATPQMEVAQAVRMSMTIPVFFKAHSWRNKGRCSLVVDGGLLKNYPIDTFDDDPSRMTIGLKLISKSEMEPPQPVTGFGMFLLKMIDTMRVAHERVYVKNAYWARTVPIDTGRVPATRFNLTEEEKRFLFESGRAAAAEALAEGLLQPQGRKGLLQPQVPAVPTDVS